MTETLPLTPGHWALDPAASSVGFEAKILLGLKAKGTFSRFEGTIEATETLATSSIALTVWTDSLSTKNKMRDGHLAADNVLHSTKHPTLEFHSTSVSASGDGFDVAGDLRVRDVTKPATFHATPVAGEPHHFLAELTVAPADFGVTRAGTTKPVRVLLDAVLVQA